MKESIRGRPADFSTEVELRNGRSYELGGHGRLAREPPQDSRVTFMSDPEIEYNYGG
jgi:hypothetical protein